MGLRSLLLASAIGLWGFVSGASAETTLAQDAAAFGAREAVIEPALSPDGDSILYLTPGPGASTIAIEADLSTGASKAVFKTDGKPDTLRWCKYVSQVRVVCRITNLVAKGGTIVESGRLIALNLDGSNAKLLGQSESAYDAFTRQYDGSVIDWLSGHSGAILMSRDYIPEEFKMNTRLVRTKTGLGVDRVDTTNMQATPVEQPHEGVSSYMTDGRGNVRLMEVAETTATGYLSGRLAYQYRPAGSRKWQQLVDFQQDEFKPLAIDADSNRLYALKKRDGHYALFGISLGDIPSETLIAENPRVDIDDVVRAGPSQRVIGYTFAEDARRAVYFDPEFKSLSSALSKALPNLPIVDFADASADGTKLLIFAGSDQDPGRYYVFDRNAKTLHEAMLARPNLEGHATAQQMYVTIPAPHGVSIPAYLTLPPGTTKKPLPAVIMPHGGPSERDEWGFDWLVQFLAARGYVVLQPEYRGSAGFGDAWLNKNGFKNWRTSIGDITASTRWLASQGIADPQRVAIVGWSYGGYAALQSAVTEPGLYKAVAAIAPITDLQLLKDESLEYTIGRMVEQSVGSGPHLSEGSPLHNARAITAPVLLVHGSLDINVQSDHSTKMDSALRSAGKQSELLTFDGLDHQLDDSAARTEMLTKIGELLDRTIGH